MHVYIYIYIYSHSIYICIVFLLFLVYFADFFGFNDTGAVHRGSLEEQWAFLLKAFKGYPNFKNGWKVFTLVLCYNRSLARPQSCYIYMYI